MTRPRRLPGEAVSVSVGEVTIDRCAVQGSAIRGRVLRCGQRAGGASDATCHGALPHRYRVAVALRRDEEEDRAQLGDDAAAAGEIPADDVCLLAGRCCRTIAWLALAGSVRSACEALGEHWVDYNGQIR